MIRLHLTLTLPLESMGPLDAPAGFIRMARYLNIFEQAVNSRRGEAPGEGARINHPPRKLPSASSAREAAWEFLEGIPRTEVAIAKLSVRGFRRPGATWQL